MKKITILLFTMLISTLSSASNARAVSMSFHDLTLSAWPGPNSWVGETDFSSFNRINVDYEGIGDTENAQPIYFQTPEDIESDQLYADLDPIEIDTAPEGSTPVPEPASMILLGLGLSAFAAFKRSKNPKKR